MPSTPQVNIDSVLTENRVFECSEEFRSQAYVKSMAEYERIYREAEADPEKFWGEIASQLHWFKPWNKVREWDCPWAKWFTGGEINLSYNCLDRHVATWRRNKAALIWEGEPGEVETLTYQQLLLEVCKCANVLKSLGVKKGDRVAIYMGMCPALPIAMLACARIGAPHTVVFGGFSANALVDRITDSQACCVITQDGSYRRGAEVKLKPAVDEALLSCPSVKNVLVYRRTGTPQTMYGGRDHWWHELVPKASDDCPAEPLDAEHPLYLLYTSGTTGKPKGILHTTGGYSVGTYYTCKLVFDLKDDDVYWCTADIGWVTGHSYIVYGPLQNGATSMMYEGAPNFPEPDRFWRLIDKHKVNIFYTAPTAIRAFMRFGTDWPKKHGMAELAAARHGRRADQSGSLDVVPRAYRTQPLPDRGYLVADRNRLDHDLSAAGRDAYHSRLGDATAAGRDRRRSDAGRGVGSSRRRRLPGDQTALAGDAAHDLWRSRPLPGSILVADTGNVLHRRRRAQRQGRLLLDYGAHRRRDQRLRSPSEHHGSGIGAGGAPQSGGGGGSRPSGRHQGSGHRRLRDAQSGQRSFGGIEG